MGEQVEDAGGVGADAAGEEHVAELGDGGVGEDALDVVLHHADGRGEEGGGRADAGDDGEGGGGAVEEDVAAGDHVDAGGDHGGGVDERGDRGGAFHGVGQPDVERESARTCRRRRGRGSSAMAVRKCAPCHSGCCAMCGEDLGEVERAEVGDEEEHREQEAEVADAVDDEGLLAGVGGGGLREPEADQQVRGEADALPADEEQQEVVGEDQDGA